MLCCDNRFDEARGLAGTVVNTQTNAEERGREGARERERERLHEESVRIRACSTAGQTRESAEPPDIELKLGPLNY